MGLLQRKKWLIIHLDETSLNFECYIILNIDIVKTATFREPVLCFTIKNEYCVNESLQKYFQAKPMVYSYTCSYKNIFSSETKKFASGIRYLMYAF